MSMNFVWAAVVLLILGIVFVCIPKIRHIGKVLLTLATVVLMPFVTLYAFIIAVFSAGKDFMIPVFAVVLCICATVLILGTIWGFIKNKKCFIPLIAVAVISVGAMGGIYAHRAYVEAIPTVGEGSNVLYKYSPFMDDGTVAALDGESSLKITEDLPVMDGATALYPVYAAFAKAVYPKEIFENKEGWMKYDNEYLLCSTTAHAYEKIVTGEADIIFVASPSKEQAEVAKSCGVELVFTPIGSEAFVFFVNSKNPMEDITLENVQKIYSGEITDWSELGVKGLGKIRAFQREEGSGSQSNLERLMEGKELMEPIKEDVVSGMGGIISRTADYKNYKNAIGYSFRFYSTEMVKNNMIKLLKINGIAPTVENIENGTYPISGNFYAITRSDMDENTKKLLEWIQGEEGQRLIEMTGYTPIK